MDSLGNSEAPFEPVSVEDLTPAVEAAVRQALHDWGRSVEDAEDLMQDVWTFYLDPRNVSAQKWIAKADTETGRRRVFYRTKKVVQPDGTVVWKRQGIISQILTGNQADDNVFAGEDSYSSESIKDWLKGESTNKYLGSLITRGMDRLYPEHLAAVRSRYEDGVIPGRKDPAKDVLLRAHIALTEAVNAVVLAEKSEGTSKPPRPGGGPRRSSGYSDPTADLAIGLIKTGDIPQELAGGGVTTYREEFETETIFIQPSNGNPGPNWAGLDLFEGELNDRTDMYRAQVFPELYPNEKPMLVQNWEPEDQAAYLGGEYTAGYRRLKVVR